MQAIINSLRTWNKNEQAVHAAVDRVLKSGSIDKNTKNFRVEVIREAFYVSTNAPREFVVPQVEFEISRAMLRQRTINLFY